MNKKEYLCKICNKNYASASSLWNHNKKFHNNIDNNKMSTSGQLLSTFGQLLSTSGQLLSTKKKLNVLQCKYCNEIFNIRQSRWKHEQNCGYKIKYDENNENIKIENNKFLALYAQTGFTRSQKYEIELLKNNTQIITNTNNSNNNCNNGNINNTINIVKFGTEKLNEILNENEMLKITEFINNSVNESIKCVHFNDKRPEFKNIIIKNLKAKNLQIFDGSNFIIDKKYKNLYELIDNHIYNIQNFINNNKNKFNENHLIKIEKFLQIIEDDTKCTINKIKYNSYYDYKVDDINTLIYNLSNKL
jgi:hypothetical protein